MFRITVNDGFGARAIFHAARERAHGATSSVVPVSADLSAFAGRAVDILATEPPCRAGPSTARTTGLWIAPHPLGGFSLLLLASSF